MRWKNGLPARDGVKAGLALNLKTIIQVLGRVLVVAAAAEWVRDFVVVK